MVVTYNRVYDKFHVLNHKTNNHFLHRRFSPVINLFGVFSGFSI